MLHMLCDYLQVIRLTHTQKNTIKGPIMQHSCSRVVTSPPPPVGLWLGAAHKFWELAGLCHAVHQCALTPAADAMHRAHMGDQMVALQGLEA
jgi:hypothetical protein